MPNCLVESALIQLMYPLAVFGRPRTPVGVEVDALSAQFEHKGADPFVETWRPSLQRFADNAVSLDDDGGTIAGGTQRPLQETHA